ncbi:hypothetical protein HK100_005793 [Physocladia obscura]|uniref:receptor protein-tyrosine kinase n=1 Tax=Physocladia obscura TaxID=109957 RepID=A0AAD5SR26_9FUNG|nr:hypothetical protein HK100_005793 [Physocladia obscura]
MLNHLCSRLPSQGSSDSSNVTPGIITAIVVGVLLILVIVTGAILFFCRRNRQYQKTNDDRKLQESEIGDPDELVNFVRESSDNLLPAAPLISVPTVFSMQSSNSFSPVRSASPILHRSWTGHTFNTKQIDENNDPLIASSVPSPEAFSDAGVEHETNTTAVADKETKITATSMSSSSSAPERKRTFKMQKVKKEGRGEG